MKVKFILVFLIILSSFAIASAQSSNIKTEFQIHGCANVGVNGCFRSSSNPLFSYFCAAVTGGSEERNVFTVDDACKGPDALQGGGDDCCPQGYYCTDEVSGAFKCELSPYACSELTEEGKDQCEDYNCYWLGEPDNGECVELSEFGCFSYTDLGEEICEDDPNGLGQEGVGTEVCGSGRIESTGQVVAPDSCECEWNDDACTLAFEYGDHIYDGSRSFTKCLEEQTLSSCSDGSQTLSWIAKIKTPTGTQDPPANDPLCKDGSKEIRCGQALVKLPAFTFFNIILVLSILAIFYIFKLNHRRKL